MDRYRVTLTPDGRHFGILDTDQYGYCGLPDEDGKVEPLQWSERASGEMWLNLCYRSWSTWEGDRKQRDKVPLRWRPQKPQTSPFDRGYQFYN